MKTQHTPGGYPAISVSCKQLEVALLFAAKKGARYYLCGVWVGKGPHGGASAARVAIGDPDFVGVVMPLRFKQPRRFDLPKWLAPVPVTVSAAA